MQSTQEFKKATLPGVSSKEDVSKDEELDENLEDGSDEDSEEEESDVKPEMKPTGKAGKDAAKKAARAAEVAAARKLLAEEDAMVKEYDPTAPIGDLDEDKRFVLSDKAARTREHLARQPLVMATIPRDPTESKDARHGFNINGFGFTLPKGKYVNIPQGIAKMISDTHGQDLVLAANHPLNLANNKDAAKEFAR